MAVTEFDTILEQDRSNWVRLRTLVTLRWVAIVGQIGAIVVAMFIFGMQIELGLAAMTIGASVLANLFSTFLYPESRRLSEREASMMLVFDILQLGLLLYLTGGLNNPFAVLMIAPVTIAATVLPPRTTVTLGILAMMLLTLIANWHMPLRNAEGVPLELPLLFQFGFWIAMMIGVVFLAIYARQVTNEMHTMSEALIATQMALAREQKLTDLGGVVAAAAHELGTPLATIKLVASEMLGDLDGHPELEADARLIGQQAERCREILLSMGRAGKEDLHLRKAPLEAVVREAAEPHLQRGRAVHFAILPTDADDSRQPVINRSPEIIHGLRNLIQNAVDFSSTTVEIEATWTDQYITIRIEDDGPGFPPSVIGRIGDPFMRRRRIWEDRAHRPAYEGMGLGLFIAKTLLERTGAHLAFANGGAQRAAEGAATGGAIVVVDWQRRRIEAAERDDRKGLGDNIPIRA
ncbi:MAG: ActS/PrrB/RegB family redox-sensitive histidine kinase [Rubellimicrobium sp.]|nr:ActS/PrrB/RegB family redox-sensitive histidine kinase [Rubellimicrobium sp.]